MECVMSMQPQPWPQPAQEIVVAVRVMYARRRAPLAVQVRDQLGELFADAQFVGAFGVRGKPAWSPGRLMEPARLRNDRLQLPEPADLDLQKARVPFGEYVTTKCWPAWKDQHPSSEYGTRKKVDKRILPTFGDISLGDLDATTIGA
jgi:hypothetical protein